MITGSGTSSTRMSCLPCQQVAFIVDPFLSRSIGRGGRRRRRTAIRARALARRLSGPLPDVADAFGAAIGADDLAGLDDLLEAVQVVVDLLLGRFVEEHRGELARLAARRPVFEIDAHDRAAIARPRLETHAAAALDVGPFERLPGDPLVRSVARDPRIPLDGRAGRSVDDPMRDAGSRRAHRLHVIHEAREILEGAPERVELVWRTIDDNASRHPDAVLAGALAGEFARAVDVERGDAEHAGRRPRDAALFHSRRSAGRGERRDVDGIAGDA